MHLYILFLFTCFVLIQSYDHDYTDDQSDAYDYPGETTLISNESNEDYDFQNDIETITEEISSIFDESEEQSIDLTTENPFKSDTNETKPNNQRFLLKIVLISSSAIVIVSLVIVVVRRRKTHRNHGYQTTSTGSFSNTKV